MIACKTQIITVILAIMLSESLAQSTAWTLENGKATSQKKISIPDKAANEIYKEINRWLIKYYRDPEENLKARVDGEYIRGVGNYSGFSRSGASTTADLQYTFIFEVVDQEVLFKITNAVLIYYSSEGINEGHRVEDYLNNGSKRKKKTSESDDLMASLSEFSNSLFESFENYVLRADNKL